MCYPEQYLIHIRIKGEIGAIDLYKPSSRFFTDRSKAVLLWICFVIFVSCLSLLYCPVCSLQACDYLLVKSWPLALLCVMFSCVLVTFLYGVPS